ncbi:hypothetical protein DPSP01_006811 [Paraphaeosphaeria sporulosa]|uniref:Uncharacterized protein n=1 Tax=Paraphaeosphaeria sporulosa TaxID=1460663 RepID=A0A177CCU3_9PLEO|nr:uncharacterized protein CC84DRAFT_1175637 [Paraphaeosphaeria sporulosa]OAG05474.1 hypothetical protein CC84DRAFT_1175637 [Paraphaeosphaeria sporulosa]
MDTGGLQVSSDIRAVEHCMHQQRVGNILHTLGPCTEHGQFLSVGVDATVFGITVEAGLELEVKVSERSVAYRGSTNRIVFAYRVVRIKLKRDGEVKYRYKSGGKYAEVDENSGEEEKWVV